MDVIDEAAIEDWFEGLTVTLVAPRRLRRELALLRAVLPPDEPSDRPAGEEEVSNWAVAVSIRLPPVPPATRDERLALRDALSDLRSRCAGATLREVRELIRLAETEAPLLLVPTVWSHRMEQLLAGQAFPARIRRAEIDWGSAWRWEP